MSDKPRLGGYKRALAEVSSGCWISDKAKSKEFEVPTLLKNPYRCEENLSSSTSSSSSHPATTSLQPEVPKDGKRFKQTMANMFLSNRLSGLETWDVASSATEAGAQGCEHLAKCGTAGQHPQNMHRDMLRALLKDVTWPTEYWAEVPVLDPDTQTEHIVDFPFMLPHEIVKHLADEHGNKMLAFAADPKTSLGQIVRDSCTKLDLDPATVIPLGLHGDGTPFAAKMRDSLEQFSYNFCASVMTTRFVFTAIPKRFVAERTMEALLAIFVWSMKVLCSGIMPSCRHDGQEWISSDKTRQPKIQNRAKCSGLPIGLKAILVQIRGDWAFYKSVFNFPSWSSDKICWLCQATRKIGSECDMRTNRWKSQRYGPGEFMAMLMAAGLLSIIFQCPGIDIRHFLIDWLHCADLGVSQSILGNLFNEVADLLPGANRKDRIKELWLRIKAWYQLVKPPSQLEGLTPEMVKQPGKGPKLRSKAGECRYLIPFAAKLAREFDDGSPHRNTVRLVCDNLEIMASCISTDPYDSAKASDACQRLRKLYVALETMSIANGDELSWKVKPKLHMLEELMCFIGPEFGSPRYFWCYTDEHWGFWLARTATRRGGPKFAPTCALNLLLKWRAIVSVDF